MKIKSCVWFLGVTLALSSCGGGGMPNFGDNEFPVKTVEASDASLTTVYPATIKGIQDVDVRPKVSGFITRVLVHEGQRVSRGQLLFTIDSETYRASVRQAQAAVNTARAQANTARLTYENNKKLFQQKIIGQFELSTSLNSYETAKASVAQAQAALISAKETLSWCNVTSPVAGVVGSLPYKVGALVSASSAEPLTTVSDVSTVEAFFSMSEPDVLSLAKTSGSVASIIRNFPPVKLQLADGTIYSHPGRVVKMSGVIDATTGAYSVIAHFTNPERLLKSGGVGQIVVPRDNNGAIVIPQKVTSQVQDKYFIYLVDKNNKVKYTEIQVNPENDGTHYIVTGGLHVGDRYVTKGITKLTDGQAIKPITEEQYAKKIAEAQKLSEQQSSAKGFVKAMSGK